MDIPIIITKYGQGLPYPKRANALDGGIDVYAARTIWVRPWSRFEVPLGFVPRFDATVVERNGTRFVKTVDVVNKGSGMPFIYPRAVKFDAGYQHSLEDPWGIRLILENASPFFRRIKRGRKVEQMVVIEVALDDFVVSDIETLRAIPPPDTRRGGRRGSSGAY